MIFRNNISIATICPLTFVESKVKTEVYPERYLQRFGATDPIHVQFISDNNLTDTFYLRAYHAIYDMYIGQVQFTKCAAPLTSGVYWWDAVYSCATLLGEITAKALPFIDNNVYFRIETTDVYNYSLPVKIESSVESIQMRVFNSANKFRTIFGTFAYDRTFVLRIDGGFAPGYLQVEGQYETFSNQSNEDSITYSNPKTIYALSVNGMSDPMWEKFKYCLMCDTILIDNIQYVWTGNIEEEAAPYGMHAGKVYFSPKTNRMTQTIEGEIMLTTQDGTLLANELSEILTISPAIV